MVSFEVDSFIEDKDETIWIATLSDGRKVYQDDDRPEHTERRAWVRLQEFCKKNNLYVVSMTVKFRSHQEDTKKSSEGYFFRKGILGSFGSDKSIRFYLTGPIIGNKIHVTKWRVPEIIIEEEEIRDIEGNEDGIIWNQNLKALESLAVQHTI